MRINTYLCTLEFKTTPGDVIYINVLAKNGSDAAKHLGLNYPDYTVKDMTECTAKVVEYVDGTIEPYTPFHHKIELEVGKDDTIS